MRMDPYSAPCAEPKAMWTDPRRRHAQSDDQLKTDILIQKKDQLTDLENADYKQFGCLDLVPWLVSVECNEIVNHQLL